MADVTTMSAGTGPIAQSGKTPQDILMEQLLNSVVAPTVNSLLDVSATSTGTKSETGTGTKTETETGTGTKTTSVSSAAQALIDKQIAEIAGQLSAGDAGYKDLVQNILNQASQIFNPTRNDSRRSGAYNSTTLDMLANDAQAKATAASADAVLQDKRAKLTALVGLIEQNAQLNKSEASDTSTTGQASIQQTANTSSSQNVEANKIGSGAATAAAVGGAAVLAKNLLSSGAGKDLTSTGLTALKKIFDMSGTSTGLPANWFQDLSSGTASVDDILEALGSQETSQAAMEDAILNVFGGGSDTVAASSGFSSWLNNSGVSPDMFSSAGAQAGGFSALTNALDGEWGWKDTGSSVGAAVGSLFGPPGSMIGSSIGSAIGEPVGDLIEGVGGAVSDAFSALDDGCFITTACMKALADDFDDSCLELTLLRQVRDEYIANLPEGEKLLAAYREYAPQYVTLINAQPDAEKIWQELYTDFILPAVRYSQDGLFKKAYLTYLFMLQYVQGVTGLRSE